MVKNDEIMTIALIGGGIYLLSTLAPSVKKTGEAVADFAGGVSNASTNLVGGLSNDITNKADNGAVDDLLHITDPLRAVSDVVTNWINKLNPSTADVAPRTNTQSINPSSNISIDQASFLNQFTQGSLSSQNTLFLPKQTETNLLLRNVSGLDKSLKSFNSFQQVARTISPNISTTSTTARYTGGVGKSSLSLKR